MAPCETRGTRANADGQAMPARGPELKIKIPQGGNVDPRDAT